VTIHAFRFGSGEGQVQVSKMREDNPRCRGAAEADGRLRPQLPAQALQPSSRCRRGDHHRRPDTRIPSALNGRTPEGAGSGQPQPISSRRHAKCSPRDARECPQPRVPGISHQHGRKTAGARVTALDRCHHPIARVELSRRSRRALAPTIPRRAPLVYLERRGPCRIASDQGTRTVDAKILLYLDILGS